VSGSPEELLRSALEKIVFFECRVASLERELEVTRAAAARAREDAASARRRESDLQAALAQSRGLASAATVQVTEQSDRVRLLEAERERFLTGLVERARVAGTPIVEGDEPGSESDLAGFIAELRAEIETLRRWKLAGEAAGIRLDEAPSPLSIAPPSAPAVPSPSPPVPPAPALHLPALASRFEEAGRIGVSREQARALSPAFTTRSERILYEASLDDLSANDPSARKRAASCLRALGSRAAAPLVAAALGREADGEVKAALLSALSALGEPAVFELALRELSDPRPGVRAAALEAASTLARGRCVPHLIAALGDPSAQVRRRSVVLLGFAPGESAEDALASALSDRDPGVARTAAAALAGRPSARAQGALARALAHHEPDVRAVAARAVARWSGEAVVDTAAPEADRRRAARRIAEKLLEMDGGALRDAVTRVPAAVVSTAGAACAARAKATAKPEGTAAGANGDLARRERSAPSPSTAVPAVPCPALRTGSAPPAAARTRRAALPPEPARPAALLRQASGAVTVAAPDADGVLAAAALGEVRTTLRGCTADEIVSALARGRVEVEAVLRALVAQGRLVARGPRFFMS
jgi:hypothetical protein